VVVLAIWGAALGPTDQMRWSSVMQALLTGWILYINLGLALEAIIRRQFSVDLLVFAVALLMYLWSLAGIARVLVTGHLWPKPLLWICVTLLGVWNLIGLTRLRATD